MFSLLFAMACTEKPTQNPKDVVLTTPKHVAATATDFQDKSFTCCSSTEATELLTKYLALASAMAADNDAQTKLAADALYTFTRTEEYKSLLASNELKEISDAAKYWTTLSRKDIQLDFSVASQTMIDFAEKNKSTTGTRIIKAFCPMAPGRWLQTESTISNPYYGSEMLTCGVFE